MENRALLPVVAGDTCIDNQCPHRRPIKRRVFAWRLIQSYSWIVTTILCAGFFGAILSQVVLAQYQSPQDRAISNAVEIQRQSWQLEDAVKEISELHKVIAADQIRITELEHNQYVMNGIGLAFVGAVGFITFIRMIAGKKIKDGT